MSDQISAAINLLDRQNNSASLGVTRNSGGLTESYLVNVNTANPMSNDMIMATSNVIRNAVEDPRFSNVPQQQRREYLTSLANNAANSAYINGQQDLMASPQIQDGRLIEYGPKYDYSRDLEAGALGLDMVDGMSGISSQVAEVKSVSSIGNVQGRDVALRNREISGNIVDPYKHINNPNGMGVDATLDQFATIGGADLTVFLIMEVVPASELAYDPALQKKELIMIEMDSALSISYSTMRERFPVRVLGQANPKAITSGIRTIAGHIALAVFTEDVLSRLRSRIKDEIDSVDEQFKSFKPSPNSDPKDLEKRKNAWEREKKRYNSFSMDSLGNTIQLLDSLPPFHILVMGTTESGKFSQFMIRNVSIIDESQYQGTQQPNIVNKLSFVALDLVPMHRVKDSSSRVATISASSVDESFSKGKYNGSAHFNQEVTGSGLLDSVISDLGD